MRERMRSREIERDRWEGDRHSKEAQEYEKKVEN